MSGKETAGITPEDAAQEANESKLHFLKRVLPFKRLGDLELSEIARTMEAKRFPPREVVLGFLGEGDCFGEISLLTQGPTTAHIQTMEETLTLTQDKEAFWAVSQLQKTTRNLLNVKGEDEGFRM